MLLQDFFLQIETTREKCNETQSNIISKTICHPFLKKYPIKHDYVLKIAKILLKLFEKYYSSDSIDTQIYEVYSQILSSKDNIKLEVGELEYENVFSLGDYVFHTLSDGHQIVCLETSNILLNGTTGFRTWPAALHLYQFLYDTTDFEKFSNVLELGCGCGFLGASLIKTKLSSSQTYTFSDHQDCLLDFVRVNLILNQVHSPSSTVNVANFDWNDNDSKIFETKFDLILASDVTFDPQVIDILVSVLKRLFNEYYKQHQRYPKCFISSAKRSQDTLDYFEQALSREQFVNEVVSTKHQPDYADRIGNVLFYFQSQMQLLRLDCGEIELFQKELNLLDVDIVPTIIYSVNKCQH